MRYFSHEWATLDGSAAQRAKDEHWNVVCKVDESVSSDIINFVKNYDLRGGLLDKIVIGCNSEVIDLTIVSGDNEKGYYQLDIVYTGARISNSYEQIRLGFESRLSRVRYDEFDFGKDGSFFHRLLLWPRKFGEIEIQFADIVYTSKQIDQRRYINYGEVVEIEED